MVVNNIERAFETGIEIIEESHGEFETRPSGWEEKSGLLSEGMAAYTQSTIPSETEGGLTMYDQSANPHTIAVDRELMRDYPERATKSLLHELWEWHAAENMPSEQVMSGHTDLVAEYNENSLCRQVNERLGEPVCDVTWNNDYDT